MVKNCCGRACLRPSAQLVPFILTTSQVYQLLKSQCHRHKEVHHENKCSQQKEWFRSYKKQIKQNNKKQQQQQKKPNLSVRCSQDSGLKSSSSHASVLLSCRPDCTQGRCTKKEEFCAFAKMTLDLWEFATSPEIWHSHKVASYSKCTWKMIIPLIPMSVCQK